MDNQQPINELIQNQPAENLKSGWRKPNKKLIVGAILVIILLLATISGLAIWYFSKNLNISDDTGMIEAYFRASCEKNGGQLSDVTECDGTTSEVCTFPGGQSCYVEQLDDGKCIGMMTPRVLCDNEINVSQTAGLVPSGVEGWQTYRNDDLGSASFEVKYPIGFSAVSKTNSSVIIEKPRECFGDGYCFSMKIEIKSLYNQGGLSIEDWFKEAGKQYTQTGTKIIAGKSSIMAVSKETEGFGARYVFGGGDNLPNGAPQYIFDILVYSGIEDSVRNQIFSTLKFIN